MPPPPLHADLVAQRDEASNACAVDPRSPSHPAPTTANGINGNTTVPVETVRRRRMSRIWTPAPSLPLCRMESCPNISNPCSQIRHRWRTHLSVATVSRRRVKSQNHYHMNMPNGYSLTPLNSYAAAALANTQYCIVIYVSHPFHVSTSHSHDEWLAVSTAGAEPQESICTSSYRLRMVQI